MFAAIRAFVTYRNKSLASKSKIAWFSIGTEWREWWPGQASHKFARRGRIPVQFHPHMMGHRKYNLVIVVTSPLGNAFYGAVSA
jgi:hypothetical protein